MQLFKIFSLSNDLKQINMKSTFTISTKLFTFYLLSFLSFSTTLFAQTTTVKTNKSDNTTGQTVIITGVTGQPNLTSNVCCTCVIPGPATVCPKSATTYSAPPSTQYSYKWTVTGNATISGADDQLNVIVLAGSVCSGSYT